MTMSKTPQISDYDLNFPNRYRILNRCLHLLLSASLYYFLKFNWSWIESNYESRMEMINFLNLSFLLFGLILVFTIFPILYKFEFKFIE